MNNDGILQFGLSEEGKVNKQGSKPRMIGLPVMKCDSFDARYDTKLAISAVVPLYPRELFFEIYDICLRYICHGKSKSLTCSFQSPAGVVP